MNYPLLSEYCSAVKEAAVNFNQLKHLRPVLDDQGEPVMGCGNFAVVFKMHDARSGKDVAVKCFLKEQEGRAESYRLFSQSRIFSRSNFLTPVSYLEKELFVTSNSTEDKEFPVVLMDWVEGETLDRYVVSHLNDPYALKKLTFQFNRLAYWLMSQSIAHGNLKPDNILVRPNGSLVLVDYDGMYMPDMRGQQARELGSPDFRHPLRTADCFNEDIDDFALTVILLSLKALSLRPSLWNDYAAAHRLLFSAADYRDLSACALLKVLPELFTDAELTRIYDLFLLAHAKGHLPVLSFKILSLAFDENPQMEEEVELSTKVMDEDEVEGVLDEFGVLYSRNGFRLLKGNFHLTEYTVREGTRVICDKAFYLCKSLVSVTLPAGLTSIGKGAFGRCKSLASLNLPLGLTSIGKRAFDGCRSLASLTLPLGLTSIGKGAFYECYNLTLYNESSHFMIRNNMLLTSDGKVLIYYFGNSSAHVPDSVQMIGNGAFKYYFFLTSVTLPAGLTSIGNDAFGGCDSLSAIYIPQGTESRFKKILPSEYHSLLRTL